MDPITCPKCGTENLTDAMNCIECRINLEWAQENITEFEQVKTKRVLEQVKTKRVLEQVKTKRVFSSQLKVDKSFKLIIQVSVGYSVYLGALLIFYWISRENLPILVLGLLLISNIFFGVMAWKRKRWGIYGMLSVFLVFIGTSLSYARYFYVILTFPLIYFLFTKLNLDRNDGLVKLPNTERKRGCALTF